MQKKLLILAVVALVLIGGAVFVWEKKRNQEVSQNEPKEEVNIVENTDTNDLDTSDWKTYRNEEYGFEFKMPNDWTTEKTITSAVFYLKSDKFKPVPLGIDSKNILFHSSGEISVWVSMNKKNLSIKDRYLQYDDVSRLYFAVNEIPRQEIKINNYDGVVFDSYVEQNPNWSNDATNHKVIILKIKNKILHFDYISQEKPNPRIEHILKGVVYSVSDI